MRYNYTDQSVLGVSKLAKHETKEKRREQIFESAINLTIQKGYVETSMEDIANAAGVSKGNVYYHFKSKQDLFLSLYHQLVDRYLERFSQIVKEASSAADIIYKVFTSYNDMVELNPDLYKGVFEFYMQGIREPELLSALNESLSYFIDLIANIINKGIENGEFRDDIDAGMTAKFIMAAGDGLKLFHIVLPGGNSGNQQEMTLLAEMFLDYLKRRA